MQGTVRSAGRVRLLDGGGEGMQAISQKADARRLGHKRIALPHPAINDRKQDSAMMYEYLSGQTGYRLSNMRLRTTVAEISRLAASGMTSDCGLSITSSVTIMLRRTGRQCMK